MIYLICRNKHRKVGKMRQRNMFQMKKKKKKQDKTSEKELNKIEIGNLHNKEI